MGKHTSLSLLPILCILVSCSPRVSEFTFVQMTDPQIGFRDKSAVFEISDSLFSKAAAAVNELNPAFVVITGDLVDNCADLQQDSIYRANKAKIKAPVYEIPGNHDIRPWTRKNASDYFAKRGNLNFYFRRYGCAFIGIDSNCIVNASEEDKSAAADFESSQYAFLVESLRKSRRCRHIFVFLHCPVIRESIDEENDYFNFPKATHGQRLSGVNVGSGGNVSSGGNVVSGLNVGANEGKREKYLALFQKYGVDVVFAGHTHMDYDTTAEGIRFVTAGPVGMPLGRGYPGYEVVTVTQDGVDCRFVKTP